MLSVREKKTNTGHVIFPACDVSLNILPSERPEVRGVAEAGPPRRGQGVPVATTTSTPSALIPSTVPSGVPRSTMTAENSAMLAKQKSALRANFVWSSRRNVVFPA